MRRFRTSVSAWITLLSAGVLLSACWLPQVAPLPGARIFQSNFFGLTCSSPTFCVAAGTSQQLTLPFFDVLASDRWTSMSAPLPSGADGNVANITSVACISVGSCIAVGNYELSIGDTQGLIETLTNGSWTATQAPIPSDANTREQSVILQSVSCGSDGTCAAIGQYLGPDIERPSAVIETLSGGSWTAMAPPVPSDAGTLRDSTMLTAVSCASATACAVLGTYFGSDDSGALIETLSSGQWISVDTPSPGAGIGAALTAISCVAQSFCIAVGSFGMLQPQPGPSVAGLIDTLSGGTWSTLQAPIPSQGNGIVGFTSVSCATDDTCAAIGDYETNDHTYVPFADSLLGGVWTANVIPLPADSVNTMNVEFPGPVSCATGLNCTVLGSYYKALGGRPWAYIASTSGGIWSSLSAPLPAGAGADSSALSLVSCPSSVLCFAFGSYSTISATTQIIDTGFNLKIPGS